MFPKQVTDVTSIAGYDLKCCGGWGHVAAEGCIRDGEPITVLHDVEIAPIPDDFVNFLVADIARSRTEKRFLTRPSPKLILLPPLAPAPVPAPAKLCPVVSRGDRYWFIRSRIRTWKNTGLSDEQIEPLLFDQIRTCCESGDDLLKAKYKLRSLIRKIPSLAPSVSAANLLRHRYCNPNLTTTSSTTSSSPLGTMRQLFKSCPEQITTSAARTFFGIESAADERRLLREFHRHGFIVDSAAASYHDPAWIRSTSSPPSSLTESIPKTLPLNIAHHTHHNIESSVGICK
jgi:hypothetical protein